jgi:peptide chain release factor 1
MTAANMFNKLEQIETRYEEMNVELAKPDVLADGARYQKLARAHAEMQGIVDGYRQWKQLEKHIQEARALLDDPEMKQMAHDELHQLEQQKQELEHQLKLLLLPKDPNDEKNVILEIRAGTGGDEATLFGQELFRMYTRFAESQGWKVEVPAPSAG